jgi:Domain of unknown function (DUF1966)
MFNTPFEASTAMTKYVPPPYTFLFSLPNLPLSIFTCEQWAVGSGGSMEVEYTLGGVPVILVPSSMLSSSGMCGSEEASTATISQVSGARRGLEFFGRGFGIYHHVLYGLYGFCVVLVTGVLGVVGL